MVTTHPAVVVFAGSEDLLKEKALAELRRSIPADANACLDDLVFHGDATPVHEIIAAARTLPFGAHKRIILVKKADKLGDDLAQLFAYAQQPSPHTILVIDVPASDAVAGLLPAGNTAISIRTFTPPATSAAATWIREYCAARKKSIGPRPIALARESAADNLAALAVELDKVIAFVGERPSIEVEDVEAVVGKSLVVSAFDLADAVEAHDTQAALTIASRLLRVGKRPYEIIGLLAWRIKMLARVKALVEEGEAAAAIARQLRLRSADVRTLSVLARQASYETIRARLALLLAADADIKRTRFDPVRILEISLVRLCLGEG